MGIAERCATAVGDDDLAWSALGTRSIDYVAALAGATRLGSDILRAKDYDTAALRRAIHQLAIKATKMGQSRKLPMSRAQAQILAVATLHEIIHPQCRVCSGAKVVVVDKLKIVCDKCAGVGIFHYKDEERQRLCGIGKELWPKWSSRYRMVLEIARYHDCAPLKAKERLG